MIVILYNQPAAADTAHAESDAGVLDEVAHVAGALTERGIPFRRIAVRTLRDAGRELAAAAEPCVFNLVESLAGSASDACLAPSVCAALGKAWTGNGTACQLLALDKWQSKCALRAAGVPAPEATVVPPGRTDVPELAGAGPLIVKPLCADASEGIEADSVVPASDTAALRDRIARIHDRFRQPALVEQFIAGRELNVSLLERDGVLTVLPPAEIDFSAFPPGKTRIVDYRAKWVADSFEYANTPRRLPADLDDAAAERIRATALAAWHGLRCRDYARIDMRLRADGVPFVVEVNPNPDISPEAGFAAALAAGGIAFPDFVTGLLRNAGVDAIPSAPSPDAVPPAETRQVRRTRPPDRDAILELVAATGVFRPEEIDVAREVLDDALCAGADGHYQSYTATVQGRVAGWGCFGPTPCTRGTFDLYWLAVHPRVAGSGVGGMLLQRIEAVIRDRHGRLIVVETSSRSDYEPARRFYRHHGYDTAACVPACYDAGDDKLICIKHVSAGMADNARGAR